VETGWNIIGGFADSTDVASITSDPAGLMASSVFRYDPSGTAQSLRVTSATGAVRTTLTADTPTATIQTPVSRLLIGTEALPATIALRKSYPNPARQSATIEYALPSSMKVRLDVYDVLGRRIARLVDGMTAAGILTVSVDTRTWPIGTYFYRLHAGTVVKTRRLTVVK
jgi:hypothetical protein